MAHSHSRDVLIRPARIDDVPGITEVYNEAVATTTATFDVRPKTPEQQEAWFRTHDDRHPVLVAECDQRVVGWGCLSSWSDRPAYDQTAETSFYVHSEYRNQGIGRRLKGELVRVAKQLGYYTLLARVAEGSDASMRLNETFGFRLVGTMRGVGHKFGRRLDVHLYQLMLEELPDSESR